MFNTNNKIIFINLFIIKDNSELASKVNLFRVSRAQYITLNSTNIGEAIKIGEIMESSGGLRHLSTILLKNFHLFKIVEINFYLKKFSN